MSPLRWGIIGTGNIARKFATGLSKCKTGVLTAVGSRTPEMAERFGQEYGVNHRHGSYEALLADKDVEAVYISTPHPMHAQWAIRAAQAGKHILCEKPLAMNHAEAMAVIEAARAHDVFLMEAFMYRCHPVTAKLVELLRSKAVGEVRVIRAAFSFRSTFNPKSRLFENDLGGGGILDVGCYPLSLARLVAGAATGKDFAEPIELKACGQLGQTGTDEYSVACLKFPGIAGETPAPQNCILAGIATGVAVWQDPAVQIFGTEGNITVPSMWIPAREGGATSIFLTRFGKPVEEIKVETSEYLYAIEADTVAANISRRQAKSPAMSWDDTLGNMKALDWWRREIGLVYDMEKPDRIETVHRRTLVAAKPSKMKYGCLAGLDKPVSRLVMGVDNQLSIAHCAVMFDDFFERGGNCFDTAHIYLGGNAERLLGQWIKRRGVRGDVVILDKGAHTPFCTPQWLTEQHKESLSRLACDHVDIYVMHRDNPDVPVSEFIDVLNQHVRAGTMRIFGASNWTLQRIEQANAYARSKNLTGFSIISNNLSLARMVDPPWRGCVASSDAESRAWLARTQMPLMPWSSQARGFFNRAEPGDTSDNELVRSWYSEDNFRRLERARQLAKAKGVEPVAIALAYVLCQDFPTFPLIGPRTLAETRTSMAALDIELTPQEVKWLNLEA